MWPRSFSRSIVLSDNQWGAQRQHQTPNPQPTHARRRARTHAGRHTHPQARDAVAEAANDGEEPELGDTRLELRDVGDLRPVGPDVLVHAAEDDLWDGDDDGGGGGGEHTYIHNIDRHA